jgi:hypothetical protein
VNQGEETMGNMTMQQELEMLRAEVEALRQERDETEQEKGRELEKVSVGRTKALREKAGKIEGEARDQLQDVLETLKRDYENISPITAVLLFALGTAFGRSISK